MLNSIFIFKIFLTKIRSINSYFWLIKEYGRNIIYPLYSKYTFIKIKI